MNYAKTALLLAGLTGLFMALGFMLGGQSGMLLALAPAVGVPDGPALLVFRPHDVALRDDDAGITGEVLAQRTIGALCRLEVSLPAVGHRIQIDLPRHARATTGAAVSLSIARSRLFAA